jgi:hypothetical protein
MLVQRLRRIQSPLAFNSSIGGGGLCTLRGFPLGLPLEPFAPEVVRASAFLATVVFTGATDDGGGPG